MFPFTSFTTCLVIPNGKLSMKSEIYALTIPSFLGCSLTSVMMCRTSCIQFPRKSFLMIEVERSYCKDIIGHIEILSKGFIIDVLVKIEVTYSTLLFFETFSPAGCVDELNPQLMELSCF